jgi:hypothetical protein
MGKWKTINWKVFVAEHQRDGKLVVKFCKKKYSSKQLLFRPEEI